MFIDFQRGYLKILYCAQQRPRSERAAFFEQLRAFMEHRIPLEFGSAPSDLRKVLELIDIVEGVIE